MMAVFALAIAAMATNPPTTKLQSWVAHEMAARHIPGMLVGVYRDGKPLEVVAQGYADIENKVRVRRQTQFEICSITKQVTAAAVLMLVQDGKMHLDDPVSRFVTGVPADWSGVTIRRLLDHTSGVPDTIFSDHLTSLPRADAIKKLCSSQLEDPPGERWTYNNTGYWLVGLAIEKASGQPFFDFLQQRIFRPLGMKHTFPNRTAEIVPWRARGYAYSNGMFKNAASLSDTVGYAAGGLISTADDLNIWSEALRSDKLLSAASRKEMLSPARLNGGVRAWNIVGDGYGLGVFVGKTNGHLIEKHSGGWDDASCQLTRFLDNGLTVIVLTNVGNYDQRSFVGERIGYLFDPSISTPTWKPAKAATPACMALAKDLLSRIASGRSINDLATGACGRKTLSMNEDFKRLTEAKPLKGLRFIKSVPQGSNTIYLFQALFGQELIAQITFASDGKVDELQLIEPPAA